MNINHAHIISIEVIARAALKALDVLPDNASRTLFVVDGQNVLLGSLTDGDIRRGLLSGLEISQGVSNFIHKNFKYLRKGEDSIEKIKKFKESDIYLVPVIDNDNRLVEILDLHKTKTLLPLTALIMAGGRGERLKPLTDSVPKPMLHVGGKPIIQYNVERLIACGVKDIYISVKYLKEKIMEHFGDGSSNGVNIHYIVEDEPLGTLGCMSLIDSSEHEDILVMNSDLLTNIDFEDFYTFYKDASADMALASIPYQVNVPYAVLQTAGSEVNSFSEKPTFTYYSNGGIYLMKFKLKDNIEKGKFFNATDLMDKIIANSSQLLVHYPLLGYWLDIGKHQDFLKAQEDIKHIRL